VIKLGVALGFLALNFYVYNYFASEAVKPPRASFDAFPAELGPWACTEPEGMGDDVERNLGVTDYLLCTYSRENPRRDVNVYVGYHASQVREEGGGAGENAIHPPAHCLPGAGWDIIDSRTVPIEFEGLPNGRGTAKRLVIAKGEARQLVYYWYQSRGRVVSEDWQKIVYVGLDRATHGRTDGSLVRFTIPLVREEVEPAEAAFQDLAPLVLAHLSDYVPE